MTLDFLDLVQRRSNISPYKVKLEKKKGCSLPTGKKLNCRKVLYEKHSKRQKENSQDDPFPMKKVGITNRAVKTSFLMLRRKRWMGERKRGWSWCRMFILYRSDLWKPRWWKIGTMPKMSKVGMQCMYELSKKAPLCVTGVRNDGHFLWWPLNNMNNLSGNINK